MAALSTSCFLLDLALPSLCENIPSRGASAMIGCQNIHLVGVHRDELCHHLRLAPRFRSISPCRLISVNGTLSKDNNAASKRPMYFCGLDESEGKTSERQTHERAIKLVSLSTTAFNSVLLQVQQYLLLRQGELRPSSVVRIVQSPAQYAESRVFLQGTVAIARLPWAVDCHPAG